MPPVSPEIEKAAEQLFSKTLDAYVSTLSIEAAADFLEWLDAHSNDENLFAELLQQHPAFGTQFAEAMEKFDADH